MNQKTRTFRDWCADALFAVSPERRRLLRSIKEDVVSRGARQLENDLNLEAVTKNAFDRYTLRMIDKYSDLRPPLALVTVLEAAQMPGDPRRLTELEEKHFTVTREISNLSGEEYLRIGSQLSVEAITVLRQSRLIAHYLLYNLDDWEIAYQLLRDRRVWNYDQFMELLTTLKESESTPLSGGML